MNEQDSTFGKYKYEKGKIYKLCCKDPSISDIYVGSTLNHYRRKNQHKQRCNNPNDKMHNLRVYDFIRNNEGFDNWDLIILEEYSAENKNDLLRRERFWIDKLKPFLNSKTSIRLQYTKSEYLKDYYVDNKEKILDYHKDYYVHNKEKKAAKCKEYYVHNKEKILDYHKEYNENNKEKIKEQRSEKVECNICKVSTTKGNLSRHKKSQKHLTNASHIKNYN